MGDPHDFVRNPWKGIDRSDRAFDTAQKALKEYYNINYKREDFKAGLSGREHWLMRYLRPSKKERFWILISGYNGNFLSACKDTVKSKDEERRKREAYRDYLANNKAAWLITNRSRPSVRLVILNNEMILRYKYRQYVLDKPDVIDTITVKFTVDGFGKVITVSVIASTMRDMVFEEMGFRKD